MKWTKMKSKIKDNWNGGMIYTVNSNQYEVEVELIDLNMWF